VRQDSDRERKDVGEERPLLPASFWQIVMIMALIVLAAIAAIGMSIRFILSARETAAAKKPDVLFIAIDDRITSWAVTPLMSAPKDEPLLRLNSCLHRGPRPERA